MFKEVNGRNDREVGRSKREAVKAVGQRRSWQYVAVGIVNKSIGERVVLQ